MPRPDARRPAAAVRLAVTLFALGAGAAALASPVDAVNDVRVRGCRAATAPPLARSPQLDAAAGRMARGASLHDALVQSGYRADDAVAIHVAGGADDAALRRLLSQRFCRDMTDPRVRQVGVAHDAHDVRLVLAAPFAPPSPGDAAAVARRVLALVNDARAKARRCGAQSFAPAPPLRLSASLGLAALAHSREMVESGTFAHESPDGSTPRRRVERTGYSASRVGENIAAGPTSADEVVRGWLGSPGHCANIMTPGFAEMGLAFVVDANTEPGIYWTQVFATPAQAAGRPSGAPRPSRSGSGVPSATNSSDTELMQ